MHPLPERQVLELRRQRAVAERLRPRPDRHCIPECGNVRSTALVSSVDSLQGNLPSFPGRARRPAGRAELIFDAHMHVGEFPLFDVSPRPRRARRADGRARRSGGVVFHPDNDARRGDRRVRRGRVRRSSGRTRACPATLEEARRFLDAPALPRDQAPSAARRLPPERPDRAPDHTSWPVERDLPVLIHCGHPIFTLPVVDRGGVRRLSRRRRSILGHMGHGNIVYINALDRRRRAEPERLPRDLGHADAHEDPEAVERVGPERVLYGSDAPFHHPVVEMEKVRLSGLDRRARRACARRERGAVVPRREDGIIVGTLDRGVSGGAEQ